MEADQYLSPETQRAVTLELIGHKLSDFFENLTENEDGNLVIDSTTLDDLKALWEEWKGQDTPLN